ncbi:conserved hypothetical protein [Neospora caninum Liverpool]|uniref:Uncharacterized protein n=1 Tax=Neospora caninum (strain Liverpool) TaxID=572307 RepID=F0V945_NEOCL|nr:conserved hypothetical protein [Neospora caninum Liverpool]CBZ50270.1 conserved hypothetical protein [Neospora caninum Liverpool]CEL64874.1 TPA: hypothetical protein BN1204_007440 [Neospora caninum Liverpool]|eukprot:XP_003880304.1 conserved hypothetical protein [Neospora caninum Liverpool]
MQASPQACFAQTHLTPPREVPETQQPISDGQQRMLLKTLGEWRNSVKEESWGRIEYCQQKVTVSTREGFGSTEEHRDHVSTCSSVAGVHEGQPVRQAKQRAKEGRKREEDAQGLRRGQQEAIVSGRDALTIRASEDIVKAFVALSNAERVSPAASRMKEQQEGRLDHQDEQRFYSIPDRGASANAMRIDKIGKKRKGKS